MPHTTIVKQASILYATPTLKSTDTIKAKLPLRKNENVNDNTNMKRKSERDYSKMHKMPRHNAKNNNYAKLKHLRRNVPYESLVEP